MADIKNGFIDHAMAHPFLSSVCCYRFTQPCAYRASEDQTGRETE